MQSFSIMPAASEAHDHFTVVRVPGDTGRNEDKRRCNACALAGTTQYFSMVSSTSTLFKHLRQKHKVHPQRPQQQQEEAAKRQRIEKQPSIHQSFVKQNNTAVRPALAELFASCSWAHHCVEWPQFIAALDAYRNAAPTVRPPTRAMLKQDIFDLAQQIKATVINRLKVYCRNYPLTVAIDGWTNVRQDKVTNVLILCGGVAFYWCSIVNVDSRNTAAWMSVPVKEALDGIKAEGLCFSALVADNEQVNKTLHGLLLNPFPFLLRSPCAAHLIQLCVNHALSLPGIQPMMIEMEELLGEFRFKHNRITLRNVQAAASGGRYLSLLKPCDTRWSSHLHAASRLLRLQAAVNTVCHRERVFWDNLTEIVRFLEPFSKATNIIQSDGSTLYDFYKQFKVLLKHVADTPISSPFHGAVSAISHVITGVWEKHVNWDAIITTAQLSFDSTVDEAFADKLMTARRWFTQWAAEYAVYWTLSAATTVAEARSMATLEWSHFLSRAPGSCFEHMEADIADITARHLQQRKLFDPKAVWSLYLEAAPILAHAAVALLSVAGSEAAVERSFSAQGLVHSDRRNRLSDKMVEAEMMIRFNRLALRRAAGEQVGKLQTKEMEGEDAGIEAAASVAELFRRVVEEKLDDDEEKAEQQQPPQQQPADEPPSVPALVRSIPRPPESADDVQRFIATFARDNSITARFRWPHHLEQTLLAAAVNNNPPIRDMISVLKKKVMAHVRGQAAEEAAAEAAAEEAELAAAAEAEEDAAPDVAVAG